jgi:hypothetical protein
MNSCIDKWRKMANFASLLFCTTSTLNYPKTTWSPMWKEGEEEDNLQKTLICNHSCTKQSLETQIYTETLCQSALPPNLQPECLKASKNTQSSKTHIQAGFALRRGWKTFTMHTNVTSNTSPTHNLPLPNSPNTCYKWERPKNWERESSKALNKPLRKSRHPNPPLTLAATLIAALIEF